MAGILARAALCGLLAAVAFASSYPTQLQYTKNQVLKYNIDGYLDARGYDDTNDYTSGGGYSTLTGLLYLQVLDVNSDYYFLSMDMFNVDVEANNTKSVSARSPRGTMTPLGDTAFVWQMFNGTIANVGFSRNDPTFFIEVKLGVVNALQTHILPVGDKTQLLTRDPVGAYLANISSTGGKQQLVITKNFTQQDVERFTDPTVNPDNVVITAGTVTGINMAGVIETAQVDEFVILVNVNDAGIKAAASDARVPPNTSSLDVFPASRGNLLISLVSDNAVSPFNVSRLPTEQQVLSNKADFVTGDLFEFGAVLVKAKAVHASRLNDVDAQLDACLAQPKDERLQWKLARYFAARPAHALLPLETRLKSTDANVVAAAVRLLARIDTEPAQTLMVLYGLESDNDAVRQQAILAAYSFTAPSPLLVKAMHKLSLKNTKLSRMALFALGALYARCDDQDVQRSAADDLLPRLALALKHNDVSAVSAALYAIANAGPAAVPEERLVAVLAASPNAVQRKLVQSVEYVMKKYHPAAVMPDQSDLPFNHTWGGGVVVGGRKINAGFNATTFAGTNFNCNQTYFNYEVIGTAASNVTLFRWHTTTFFSQTTYGLINGQPAADRILVEIFGKVFYDEPLPSVDCFQETIPIFTQQTGLNKQYTLWISVIPVTFTATVQLTLNLDVEFEACLDKLSADVQLLPTATLTFGGGAEMNLLIVKAGIRLEGSFASTLVPEVYVHGSECLVGVQATLQVPPQEVDLEGYSDIDICVLWVFDCHWGPEYTHKFLDWTYPGQNKILYNQEWKIHL